MIQSINQLRNINISYEQLEGIYFNMEEPFLLSVEWQGINYEFIIRMKLQSKTYYFGFGASEKQSPPIFQRYTWIKDFEESVIFYNDPTLYLGEISLGWGKER